MVEQCGLELDLSEELDNRLGSKPIRRHVRTGVQSTETPGSVAAGRLPHQTTYQNQVYPRKVRG